MFAVARTALIVILGFLLASCASVGRSLGGLLHSDRPLALAQFEENRIPVAPNSHGTMVGFIPTTRGSSDLRDILFTYRVDFHVVSSREMGRQIDATGVRRVFFSPNGVRASFADPLTFSRGRPVEVDLVRFHAVYTPEEGPLMTLRMRTYESFVEPIVSDSGRVVTPPEGPSSFTGRVDENFDGWLLSASPMSF
jgi:hypothetical protein